jgi:hypothetical protein
MPALDIATLKKVNLAYSNRKGAPMQFVNGSVLEKLEYMSSSSEDSKQKAKIRDIEVEPRQRKRLLDSLNIVTTRTKWQNLNQSV